MKLLHKMKKNKKDYKLKKIMCLLLLSFCSLLFEGKEKGCNKAGEWRSYAQEEKPDNDIFKPEISKEGRD